MSNPSLGRTILTYLIAGPPAGALALVVYMSTLDAIRGFPQPVPNLVNGLPLIIAFGYILGALPAIITSLAMASLAKRNLKPWQLIASSVPVGIAATLVCLFWLILGPNTGETKESVVAMFSIVGGTAGLVSSSLLYLMTRRRPAA
jgi:hypothetical protein